MAAFATPLLAAFLSCLEAMLVCAAGAVLTRFGVMTPAARHALSRIGFYILLPAITFVKVAEAVDAPSLASAWPLLANGVLTVALGAALGAAAAAAAGAPADLRAPAVAAATIGNASIVPLLVVVSLCSCDGLAVTAALGRECATRGVAYVAIGGAVVSVLHHVAGYHLLKPKGWDARQARRKEHKAAAAAAASACSECGAPHVLLPPSSRPSDQGCVSDCWPPSSSSSDDGDGDRADLCALDALSQAARRVAAGTPGRTRRRWAASRPASSAFGGTVRRRHSAPETTPPPVTPPRPPAAAPPPPPPAPLRALRAVGRCLAAIEAAIPLPALLSLSGLVVGCIPPLKRLLFAPHAPLGFFAHTLHTVAGATTPVLSFLIGSALAHGPAPRGTRASWRLVAALAAVRLLILPLLAAAIVFGTGIAGLWEAVDPMFVLVLVLVHATPTAPAVQALATLFHAHEAEMAAIIFWQYALYVVTMPLLLAGAIAAIDAAPLRWRVGGALAPSNDPALVVAGG